uniref:Uncharacterized protein n=1 Tax=Micrurus spixii TaxID=129469 RepID=A0A2D4LD46_9SAUR
MQADFTLEGELANSWQGREGVTDGRSSCNTWQPESFLDDQQAVWKVGTEVSSHKENLCICDCSIAVTNKVQLFNDKNQKQILTIFETIYHPFDKPELTLIMLIMSKNTSHLF